MSDTDADLDPRLLEAYRIVFAALGRHADRRSSSASVGGADSRSCGDSNVNSPDSRCRSAKAVSVDDTNSLGKWSVVVPDLD